MAVPPMTSPMDDLIEQFREDHEMVTFDDLDEAIIGVASQWSKQPLVVYDREKMIHVFMKQNHWTYEEAEEWVGFNVDQVWAGEGTPLIMVKPEGVYARVTLFAPDGSLRRLLVLLVVGVLAAATLLLWLSLLKS